MADTLLVLWLPSPVTLATLDLVPVQEPVSHLRIGVDKHQLVIQVMNKKNYLDFCLVFFFVPTQCIRGNLVQHLNTSIDRATKFCALAADESLVFTKCGPQI